MRRYIANCARCGQDHRQLYFREFQRAPAPVLTEDGSARLSYKWWGTCPRSGDPILLVASDPVVAEPLPAS